MVTIVNPVTRTHHASQSCYKRGYSCLPATALQIALEAHPCQPFRFLWDRQVLGLFVALLAERDASLHNHSVAVSVADPGHGKIAEGLGLIDNVELAAR